MFLPIYLAMTGQEITQFGRFSSTLCYFACHFSSTSPGLSGLPPTLPANTILCIDDSTPIEKHDPALITTQLRDLLKKQHPIGLLLDFQRPNNPHTPSMIEAILKCSSCPVAVSHIYATEFNCPVFLPPVPLRTDLSAHLRPWSGREIWLELAPDNEIVTISTDRVSIQPVQSIPFDDTYIRDIPLLCHYSIEIKQDCIAFSIGRTAEDLVELQKEAQKLGVSKFIGLWQQLQQFYS